MEPVQQGTPQDAAGQQCIFCQVISGAVPSRKVYEDEVVLAILDIRPASPGHLLIMPKQHVMTMSQLSPDAVARLGITAKVLSKVLLQSFQCNGTTLFVANGAAAGQRTPHFMMHLIPRQDDDGLPLQLNEQVVAEEFLKKLKAKLTGEPVEDEKEPAKQGEETESVKKEPEETTEEGVLEEQPEEGQQEEEVQEEEIQEEETGENEEVDLDDVEALFR